MSDEPKKRSRAWIGWSAGLLLFVLYPLSIGPATWLVVNKRPQMLEAWGTTYDPLLWVAHRSDMSSDLLNRYLGLWVDMRPL
jgi:hypothetical protein